jgi:hypothetical protein
MARSNVVPLPTRCDLDQLGCYAALTVMAVELARLAVQGGAGAMEITLNGERRTLTREAALAIAQNMLEQRQNITDVDARVAERVARAIKVMKTAEAMLDQSTGIAARS